MMHGQRNIKLWIYYIFSVINGEWEKKSEEATAPKQLRNEKQKIQEKYTQESVSNINIFKYWIHTSMAVTCKNYT
jgi:hypothetical protein